VEVGVVPRTHSRAFDCGDVSFCKADAVLAGDTARMALTIESATDVGAIVGESVGTAEGESDGRNDGIKVGAMVGRSMGDDVVRAWSPCVEAVGDNEFPWWCFL